MKGRGGPNKRGGSADFFVYYGGNFFHLLHEKQGEAGTVFPRIVSALE